MNETLQNLVNLFSNVDAGILNIIYADYFVYSVIFSLMILLVILK